MVNIHLNEVCFFQVITDDDVDRISLCVRVVAERVPLMKEIFTVECRNSLSTMLDASKRGDEEKQTKVTNESSVCRILETCSYRIFPCNIVA